MPRRAELIGITRPEMDERRLEREASKMEDAFDQATQVAPSVDSSRLRRQLERAIPGGGLLGSALDRARGGAGGGQQAVGGGEAASPGVTGTGIQGAQLKKLDDIHDELKKMGFTEARTAAGRGGGGGGGGIGGALGLGLGARLLGGSVSLSTLGLLGGAGAVAGLGTIGAMEHTNIRRVGTTPLPEGVGPETTTDPSPSMIEQLTGTGLGQQQGDILGPVLGASARGMQLQQDPLGTFLDMIGGRGGPGGQDGSPSVATTSQGQERAQMERNRAKERRDAQQTIDVETTVNLNGILRREVESLLNKKMDEFQRELENEMTGMTGMHGVGGPPGF